MGTLLIRGFISLQYVIEINLTIFMALVKILEKHQQLYIKD